MEYQSLGFCPVLCAHKKETPGITVSILCTTGVELGQKSRAAQYRQ